jgi:hypothetical protein
MCAGTVTHTHTHKHSYDIYTLFTIQSCCVRDILECEPGLLQKKKLLCKGHLECEPGLFLPPLPHTVSKETYYSVKRDV